MTISTKRKESKGFVIFYAVLVTSIVLVVSLLVSDILTRQIIIGSLGTNYQYAYYIAQAGNECARHYVDDGYKFFGRIESDAEGNASFVESDYLPIDVDNGLKDNSCSTDGNLILDSNSISYDYTPEFGATTVFRLTNQIGACAEVKVDIGVDDLTTAHVKVISKGYNIGCDEVNPRKVTAEIDTWNLR